MEGLLNRAVCRSLTYRGLFNADDYSRLARFYALHRELASTPTRSLPGLAARIGLGQVLVKDESDRWGIEAFKIAGVRYAVEQLDRDDRRRGFVCATAGNHGRAVARAARDLDVSCTVFVPAARARAAPVERATRTARVDAMRSDGANVIETGGSYERAVALAAEHGTKTGATIVSDVSWPGYDAIPRSIMIGYTRLFDEAAAEWSTPPDVVLIQGGVGGLVCAAANWFSARYGPARPFLIACEPEHAACLLESCRAGRPIDLAGIRSEVDPAQLMDTIMAGLRCAVPSPAAWPSIHNGIDAFITVPDALVLEAMDVLRLERAADQRIDAGPSGACGVAALIALMADDRAAALRQAAGLGPSTRVMAIVTEGP
jgi:diaminopropionate ammonia-lyase